uniref:histone acetyltransferase n=1 Tax=Heterorhabditis bacteriophora TaxID=37862 RepID=A0A1I7WVZ2_HETBA
MSSRITQKRKHLEVDGSDIETKRNKLRVAVKVPRSTTVSRFLICLTLTPSYSLVFCYYVFGIYILNFIFEVLVATSPNNNHSSYSSEQGNAKTLSGQRTSRTRRRRRKLITMKKYKKKTFLDSMKGTPIRQPSPLPVMNAEELVAESGGMLTLEAAEDFSVVQMRVARKCPLRGAPPGHEIYRDTHNNMSVFEVNGEKMPTCIFQNYCANLCRLTMMWLGDKVVFADVEPFFFYILANSSEGYLLSRLEFLPGGPERPLSALGAIAYKKYWRNTIITALYNKVNENGVDEIDLSLSDLSMRTGMREEDVAETIGILFKCKRVSKKAVTMFVNMGQLIAEGSKIVNLNRIMAVENYLNVDFLVEIRRRRAERLSELIGSPTRSSIKIL